MKWRIFYGDGTTYDGDAFAAPARNVQVIVTECDDVGRYLCAKVDYYWYNGNENEPWAGGDIFGLFDYLQDPGPKKVLFGRTIGNEQHQALIKSALEDPEFPIKSANRPRERY